MNNRHFTNENPFTQDCSTSTFPNNPITPVPSAELDPNSLTEYAAQWSFLRPGYLFPQPPQCYGYDGQMYHQNSASSNQQLLFAENNQTLPHQPNPALGLPIQPSEFRPIGLFHQITPPCNIFGQDSVPFSTPLQGQYPITHQIQNTQLGQNVFPSTSNREFYPQHPLEQTAVPLNNSMFLPNIRQCISFAPVDERTDANHDQSYHKFVAGIQGQLQSTAAEQQNPSTSGNSLESQPHLHGSQDCKMVHSPGVYHVEVPCPTTDPNNSSIQLFEVNFNFSNMHQTCKVVFYLENSLHGLNRNLTARVSTNVSMNEIQRKEDELQNNSQVEHFTIKQKTDEAVPQDSNAFTSDETHQLSAPPTATSLSSKSSSQQSLTEETSEENSSQTTTN